MKLMSLNFIKKRLPLIISTLVMAMGIINIISAVTPSLDSRLQIIHHLFPLDFRLTSHLLVALIGIELLILAYELKQYKRRAWYITIILLIASIVFNLVKGLDVEEASFSLLIIMVLLATKDEFSTLSEKPTLFKGFKQSIFLIAIVPIYGTIGLYLLRHEITSIGSIKDAFFATLQMFYELSSNHIVPHSHFANYFINSIYLVSMFSAIDIAFLMFKPLLSPRVSNQERQRAKTIVDKYAHSSLARFLLFPDKRYFFSKNGSVISFVVKNDIALVLGDPVGPSKDVLDCLVQFKEYCKKHSWIPAYYQVPSLHSNTYKKEKYKLLLIGCEGIVNLDSFTLSGSKNKNLRTSLNKLTRERYQAIMLTPPHSNEIINQLRDISNQWLSVINGSEKVFSLGYFDKEYLNSTSIMVVKNAQGLPVAFANVITNKNSHEVTIDLMRHYHDTENGVMDFLFIKIFEWAKENGFKTFNLGLSPLYKVGNNKNASIPEKTLHFVYEKLNQFYAFKGLHKYKEKFQPDWSPRYLVYSSTTSLPKIIDALMKADSGDDYVVKYIADLIK